MTALVSRLHSAPKMSESFVCVECGCVFQEPKQYIERHGLDTPPYEEFTGCPKCGGAYVPAKQCEYCGKNIIGEYVKIADGNMYCENCFSLRDISDDLI